MQTGVKQGDPLSATLFSIVMDAILKKMELRGNISTRLKQCSAYADDVLITTRTAQAMIDTFVKLRNESLKYGLIVNTHKTKYMKCTRRQDQLTPININNKEFEQVKSFKHLGSIINTDNTMEEEIKERIALGNKAYFANKKIFQSKIITKRAKLKLYHSIIRPIVTYSCETWILKGTTVTKLLVFERKMLRKIFGPNNENGIWRIKTNQELDEIIKSKNIINFIRTQRLSWLGHIERMQGMRMLKAIYSWNPVSRRLTGRPKICWVDDVRKDIQKLKVPNWKTLAQDRRGWKEKLVEKAKTL